MAPYGPDSSFSTYAPRYLRSVIRAGDPGLRVYVPVGDVFNTQTRSLIVCQKVVCALEETTAGKGNRNCGWGTGVREEPGEQRPLDGGHGSMAGTKALGWECRDEHRG